MNLNLAEIYIGTEALGPGKRAAIWVQGCPFACRGCIAPEWTIDKPAQIIPISELVGKISQAKELQGLTISGGEPMLQAKALTLLIKELSKIKEYDVICFTGYKLDQLRKNPPNGFIWEFLEFIDVLVDGPYIEPLNNNLGLRGSSNQKIHYLSNRLKNYDFENQARKVEIVLKNKEALMVGIPSQSLLKVFNGLLGPESLKT
jgi:anaerobic ribonucleoside-triphosphate reductase activating protein